MKTVLRMLTMALLMFAVSGFAQNGDTTALRPPKGSKVAIMVFEDLECPYCAHIEPTLQDAVKNYKIPLVRYDFPISAHPWSFQAHVDARFFDTKTKELGEEFRRWIFTNQSSITKLNLRAMVERFATEHHISLPTFIDPNGELAAKVKADYALGEKIGIDHTPTVYVVSTSQQKLYIEVKELSQLFSVIDQINAQLAGQAPAPASKQAKGASGKGASKFAAQ